MKRAYAAVAVTVGLFLLVQIGALALVQPFMDAGYQTVDDPSDPTNSVVYVGAILVATAVMLVAMRFGVDLVLQGLVVFASVFLAFFVFSVVVPAVVTVGSVNVLAGLAAVALGVGLLAYPEWYVIDAAGVLMGAGAAGLFGISFGLLPAVVLLVILAVYDAVSVYGTEHMLALASGVMDLKLPVVLVVPLTASYSFIADEGPETLTDEDERQETLTDENETQVTSNEDERQETLTHGEASTTASGDRETPPGSEAGTDASRSAEAELESSADAAREPGADVDPGSSADREPASPVDDREGRPDSDPPDPFERDAFFIGLGDAVIPTILVASAAFFRPGDVSMLDVPGIALTVPALGAMTGTIAGLLVLMGLVMKGRAHAGLPLLNGGAIAGYLLGAVYLEVALVEALGLAPYL